MKKGFTLIEMAMVLLVVGILAGLVIRNLGRQPAVARDTRRIADLRNTTNYLANYLAKYGHFPTSTDWSSLETALRNAGIVDRLPRDPSGGNNTYYYYPCSDIDNNLTDASNINHFILRAKLEQTFNEAPRFWNDAITSTPQGWTCWGSNSSGMLDESYYVLAEMQRDPGDLGGGSSGAININEVCNPDNKNYCLAQ